MGLPRPLQVLPLLALPLLFLAAQGAFAAAADEAACKVEPVDPVVNVQIRLPSVSHDLSLDGQAIARRAVEAEPRIDHDHDWVDGTVGLTTVQFTSDYSLGLEFGEAADGQLCVQVRSVNAVFGFSRMVVYVASEYDTDSCAYKEVLNHEHIHVQIFRDEVLKARRPFADAIAYALRTNTPFRAADRAAAQEQARRILANGVRPVMADMWAQGDVKHALLDSTESYRRTERQCADW